MNNFTKLLVAISLFAVDTTLCAQVGQGFAGGRSAVGGRVSFGASQAFSGRAVNPNFNPRGSLSTFGNFNPRGSISPALNLNPRGSLLRPQTGSVTSARVLGTPSRYSTYKVPVLPSYSELRYLPRTSLLEWSTNGFQQLENSLSEFNNGGQWRTYLQLDKIEAALTTAEKGTLEEETRTQLRKTLERFRTVSRETKFMPIRRLPGFSTIQMSLAELARADAGDHANRMMNSARAVDEALSDIEHGESWQKYLALPQLIEAHESIDADAQTQLLEAAETSLQQIRKVQHDPKYQFVTKSIRFRSLAENLDEFLQNSTKDESAAQDG